MPGVLNESISSFGKTGIRLARNPLGIIALFIVLVYALAALAAGFGHFDPADRRLFVWFLVAFPFAVLGSFLYLVTRHSTKLYAPQDFADSDTYLRAMNMSSEQRFVKVVEASARSVPAVRSAIEPILRSEVTNSQVAAFQYITRWNSDYLGRRKTPWAWNFFEEMSIGISRKIIDESIAKDYFHGIAASEWHDAQYIIREMREQGTGPSVYANFENLVARWGAP